MQFPREIFEEIISFLPKYLIIDPYNKCTKLHLLCSSNNPTYKAKKEIKKILDEYDLKDNNYLQNSNGHTPLHIAYQFSNYYAVNLLEKKYPMMKTIRQKDGELPIYQKDLYNKTRFQHDG
tara:strand:- start:2488 stop:2850 length:363 start_codon:yes stop_codon:yes gene_type:complete